MVLIPGGLSKTDDIFFWSFYFFTGNVFFVFFFCSEGLFFCYRIAKQTSCFLVAFEYRTSKKHPVGGSRKWFV